MSRSVNKIILVGHVGRDPELRETKSGTKVAHFSLATNHRIPANGEAERERTDWHRLTLWNRLASFAEEYVKKGDKGLYGKPEIVRFPPHRPIKIGLDLTRTRV